MKLIKNDISYITPLKSLEDYFKWTTDIRLLLEQESFKNIIDYEDRFLDSDDLFINKIILNKTVLYGPPNTNKHMHRFIENIKYRISEHCQNTYFTRPLSQIKYTGNAKETTEQMKKITYMNKQVREIIDFEIQSMGTEDIALQLATTPSVRCDLVRANMVKLHRNSSGKSIHIEKIEIILTEYKSSPHGEPMQAMIQKAGVSSNTNYNIGDKRPKPKKSWNNKKAKGLRQNLKVINKEPYKCWYCHRNLHKGHKCKANPEYGNNVNYSKACQINIKGYENSTIRLEESGKLNVLCNTVMCYIKESKNEADNILSERDPNAQRYLFFSNKEHKKIKNDQFETTLMHKNGLFYLPIQLRQVPSLHEVLGHGTKDKIEALDKHHYIYKGNKA